MVPRHQYIGSQGHLLLQKGSLRLGLGIPHQQERRIAVGDTQHQRIVIELFPQGAAGGGQHRNRCLPQRQGVPRKQVGRRDLLPRKGIQQLFVGKGGGQLLFRHSGGIKGSGRQLFQHGAHPAVVVAVGVGQYGSGQRLDPGTGESRQHLPACGILPGIHQNGVLTAGQQQALRLPHINDPEGQPCGGRVGGRGLLPRGKLLPKKKGGQRQQQEKCDPKRPAFPAGGIVSRHVRPSFRDFSGFFRPAKGAGTGRRPNRPAGGFCGLRPPGLRPAPPP